MACNLINVGFGTTDGCKENFSGIGGTAYFFLKKDVPNAPKVSDEENRFEDAAFTGVPVYKIKLKKKVNKVDWTNMDTMAFNGRTLNNLGGDFGVMIPKSTADGTKDYYVIYNHEFGTDFTNEGTTGDAPDSDHGHTITVAATMFYGPCLWSGELTEAGDSTVEGE